MKRIPRLNAAEGMLKEAVRMLFTHKDVVSVFSLAESAYHLLQVVATRGSVAQPESRSGDMFSETDWDTAWGASSATILSAITDCGDDIEVDEEKVHTVLLEALLRYARVEGGVMSEGQVFIIWFALKYPSEMRRRCHGSMVDPNIAQGLSPEDMASFNQLLDHPELFPLLMKKGFWKNRNRAVQLQKKQARKSLK